MNIYVGNLSYSVTEDQLRDLFSQFGGVTSVKVITDRATGRSKGFGFVEMDSNDSGEAAVAALNQTEFDGRTISVNPARPKEDRGPGGGGGGGRRFPPRGGGGGRRDRDDY